ncbi:MAG: hypothetical protein GEV11_13910 [Streptosporangiales bacterium]|nr:hypothetical protein [Streptosporangiales bacterium]
MRHVRASGVPADDDRGPVLEAEPVLFEIAGFADDDAIVSRFGDAAKMPLYRAKFTRTTVIPPFKYSYGARLRALRGVDQIRWVTRLLRHRPYSKSAWVSLTVPGERYDAVPCLTGLAFRIRDGRLLMTAAFRSQNAFTAYLNYLPLRTIQTEVAAALGLPHGPMRVFVDVPHVYVADLAKVDAILAADTAPGRNGSRPDEGPYGLRGSAG